MFKNWKTSVIFIQIIFGDIFFYMKPKNVSPSQLRKINCVSVKNTRSLDFTMNRVTGVTKRSVLGESLNGYRKS